jgi:hypothetical protein
MTPRLVRTFQCHGAIYADIEHENGSMRVLLNKEMTPIQSLMASAKELRKEAERRILMAERMEQAANTYQQEKE